MCYSLGPDNDRLPSILPLPHKAQQLHQILKCRHRCTNGSSTRMRAMLRFLVAKSIVHRMSAAERLYFATEFEEFGLIVVLIRQLCCRYIISSPKPVALLDFFETSESQSCKPALPRYLQAADHHMLQVGNLMFNISSNTSCSCFFHYTLLLRIKYGSKRRHGFCRS